MCLAGPSFNSNSKALATLSSEGGAELHGALANVHLMLQFLEQGKPEEAQQSKAEAAKGLANTMEIFRNISSMAPKQPLVIQPKTDLEKRCIESLRQALKARDIPFPETEQDLARVAVRLVSDFQKA